MKIKLLIMFITFWIAPSILIDFVAAPAIFRNVSSLQEAGTLGMVIFKAFNSLEVLLALIVFGLSFALVRAGKIKKPWLVLFSILVMWSCFIRFHVSPAIIDINQARWELPEESAQYEKLTNDHQFYHKLYVKMEGTKVILLLIGLVMVFRIREEETV